MQCQALVHKDFQFPCGFVYKILSTFQYKVKICIVIVKFYLLCYCVIFEVNEAQEATDSLFVEWYAFQIIYMKIDS